MPERPKGMSAGARRAWDEYMAQLAPMGILRKVDGFALSRLCEDVSLLGDLRKGERALIREKKREAKATGEKLPGGALISLAVSQEGRRLHATINSLAQRIKRDEAQFGLTPVAGTRLEGVIVPIAPSSAAPTSQDIADPEEAALCG